MATPQQYEFGDIQVYTGIPEKVTETALTQQVNSLSSVSVEQSKAIAEVQARTVIAHLNPRDENSAYLRIVKACKRRSLAEKAVYKYPRGGQSVSGPSIRLAETLARHWGNLEFGFKEMSRQGDESTVKAFCWDLETNTYASREFVVRHYRDTKSGLQKLDAERDKYELIANMAQRRVRACILEVVPGDVVESAVEECRKTLASSNGKPLEDRIRDMIKAFDELPHRVTQAELEAYISHPIAETSATELVELIEIYRTLKDGDGEKVDFFKPGIKATTPSENGQQSTKATKKKPARETEKPQEQPLIEETQEGTPFDDLLADIRECGTATDIEAAQAALTGDPDKIEDALQAILTKIKQR